jgi:hypothetical protein
LSEDAPSPYVLEVSDNARALARWKAEGGVRPAAKA